MIQTKTLFHYTDKKQELFYMPEAKRLRIAFTAGGGIDMVLTDEVVIALSKALWYSRSDVRP